MKKLLIKFNTREKGRRQALGNLEYGNYHIIPMIFMGMGD